MNSRITKTGLVQYVPEQIDLHRRSLPLYSNAVIETKVRSRNIRKILTTDSRIYENRRSVDHYCQLIGIVEETVGLINESIDHYSKLEEELLIHKEDFTRNEEDYDESSPLYPGEPHLIFIYTSAPGNQNPWDYPSICFERTADSKVLLWNNVMEEESYKEFVTAQLVSDENKDSTSKKIIDQIFEYLL